MARTLLALLLTLAALPSLAQDVKALGFTQDGETLVLDLDYGGEDSPRYILYDARSSTKETPESRLTSAQYKAWAAENPLAPLKSGPRSADGKTQLESGKGLRWKNGQLWIPASCEDEENPRKAPRPKTPFRAKTGKKSWLSAELALGNWNADLSVEPLWSPDGRRVAYLVHVVNGCYGAVSDYELWFGPTQGPRVQLLSVKERPYEDVSEAMSALEGAGFAPTSEGEAKGAHAGTVVFAAKGFEAEAKKAAAALPGAKVDKLTWKPGHELVVVLGSK